MKAPTEIAAARGGARPGPVARTLDKAVAAAQRCFVRFGLEKTTMEDIAAEANLSRATIYRYFNSKMEIAEEIGLRGVAAINAAVLAKIEPIVDPIERLVEAIATSIEFVSRDVYLRGMLTSEMSPVMQGLRAHSQRIDELTRARYDPLLYSAIDARQLSSTLSIPEVIDWIMLVEVALITRDAQATFGADGLRAYLSRYVIQGLAAR
jgi:AcrR family transcriptional regulator